MSDPVAVLTRAKGLIETGWCKGAEARDSEGMPVRVSNPRAVSWCLRGAVSKAADELTPFQGDYAGALRAYNRAYGCLTKVCHPSPVAVNDDPSTTLQGVVARLDSAIEVAKTQYPKN